MYVFCIPAIRDLSKSNLKDFSDMCMQVTKWCTADFMIKETVK